MLTVQPLLLKSSINSPSFPSVPPVGAIPTSLITICEKEILLRRKIRNTNKNFKRNWKGEKCTARVLSFEELLLEGHIIIERKHSKLRRGILGKFPGSVEFSKILRVRKKYFIKNL